MTQQQWMPHIGRKVDIVEGEFVLSDDGFLTVSKSPVMYSLYIDQATDFAVPIVPKSDFRGRPYRIGRSDCLTLFVEWSDAVMGTNLREKLNAISRRTYMERVAESIHDLLIDAGFSQIDPSDAVRGDMLVYKHINHVCAYLGDQQILHILPRKWSSIDTIDFAQVTEAYRYAG